MRKPVVVAALALLGWLAFQAVAQSPKVVRTAPLTMTGMAPSAQEIATAPITMTGTGATDAQPATINTGRIEMTGKR